jgi:predicted nucleic acid-binding protein
MPGHEPLLIYLGTNVYSRPFDDQTEDQIQEETNAFLPIVAEVRAGALRLLDSTILQFEVHNVIDDDKRTKILAHLELCSEHIHESEEILSLGKRIKQNCHTRARDALHIASAILANARYFLSCDNQVTQKKQANCYRRLAKDFRNEYFSVMKPTMFVEKIKKGKLE